MKNNETLLVTIVMGIVVTLVALMFGALVGGVVYLMTHSTVSIGAAIVTAGTVGYLTSSAIVRGA